MEGEKRMVSEKCFVGEVNADKWEWSAYVDLSWEGVKNRILPKIVNFERNESLLYGVPHIKYLDLAVIFYIPLSIGEGCVKSIAVKNEHICLWNVDINDILMNAKKNAVCYLPESVCFMDDLIVQMLNESKNKSFVFDDMLEYIGKNQHNRILVLSNQVNIFGASCMIYDGVLQRIADSMESDLYILPSSIHELLLLKADGMECGYRQIVQEINSDKTLVSDKDYLSDNVYYYDRLEGKLSIV